MCKLNNINKTKLGLFEKELNKTPWYIKLWVDFKFKLIDIKYYLCKKLKK